MSPRDEARQLLEELPLDRVQRARAFAGLAEASEAQATEIIELLGEAKRDLKDFSSAFASAKVAQAQSQVVQRDQLVAAVSKLESDLRKAIADEDIDVLSATQAVVSAASKFGSDRLLEAVTQLSEEQSRHKWGQALASLREGSVVTGTVSKLTEFGAFVQLEAGVSGLVHISALSNARIRHPSDVVAKGESVLVMVESVDKDQRRIRLRLVRDGVPVGLDVDEPAKEDSKTTRRPSFGGTVSSRTRLK